MNRSGGGGGSVGGGGTGIDNPREMSIGEYSDRDGGIDSDQRLSRTFPAGDQGGVLPSEDGRAAEFARQLIASVLAQSQTDPFYSDGNNRFIAQNEGACSCSGE